MITLPKIEYQKILRNQSDFTKELRQLKSVVRVALADEVTDQVRSILEGESAALDRGEGKRFKSAREFSKYLKDL